MSDHDVPELSEELRDLLASERGRPDPDAEMAARLLARVHATVSAASPTDTQAPEPATPHVATAQAAQTVVAAAASKSAAGLVLLAFVAGAGLGALGHAKLAAPEVQTRVEIREVVRTVEVPTPALAVPIVTDAGVVDAGAHETLARDAGVALDASVSADADTPAETGRDLGLADENALVTRAQTALARGRAGEALEALFEHQRRFPRGQFTEEREALAIQALARLGRMEQAAARAERFRARYPGSLMMRVVDQAVRTE